jgi:dihydropyrimidinase
MDLIIRNANIVNPYSTFWGDIAIKNGKIQAIGQKLELHAKTIIDAENHLVFPGIIDPHVHFHLPIKDTFSSDDFVSGSKAALYGGVTTIIDFTNQVPGSSLLDSLDARLREISENCFCDYSLHSVVNSWKDDYKFEIEELLKKGINSFKFFMYAKGEGERWDDGLHLRLQEIISNKGMIILHAENKDLIDEFTHRLVINGELSVLDHAKSRPPIVEEEAINRAALIAENTNSKAMVLHLSSKKGLDAIKNARKRGVKIMAETCPQYLLLDDSIYSGINAHLFATCPPVRKRDDINSLWDGINNGDISIISTDHCPFRRSDKEKWGKDFRNMYFGLPGVETTLPLLYTYGVKKNKIDINLLVRLLSYNASKAYGLSTKGSIEIGKDADIMIFDSEYEWKIKPEELHMNCSYNPYSGMKVNGRVNKVLLRGNLMIDNGVFVGENIKGRFIKRGEQSIV